MRGLYKDTLRVTVLFVCDGYRLHLARECPSWAISGGTALAQPCAAPRMPSGHALSFLYLSSQTQVEKGYDSWLYRRDELMEKSNLAIAAPNRDKAWALLCEYTKGESLRKHALAVESAVRFYAKKYGEDEELWGICGLLHDFDYEQYPDPTPEGHPFVGCKILEEQGYPPLIIEAILGHAQYSGVKRESSLAKALFACDELAGFVTASVLVRPDKSIHNLEVKSVRKKMKDKAFAKGVNREDIIQGACELGVELDEHIANVIAGMKEQAVALGLNGN